MLVVSPEQRRRLIARRHLLHGNAKGADEVVAALAGLHATDPATPFLSVFALSRLRTLEVDLDGRVGLTLNETNLDTPDCPLHAVLLPSLDSTSMGWKERDRYLALDRREIFDSAGNIGPTLWWNGEIVGSWAVAASGEVRTALRVDRGADAAAASQAAAADLQQRLQGTVVTPSIRTPLEKSLH